MYVLEIQYGVHYVARFQIPSAVVFDDDPRRTFHVTVAVGIDIAVNQRFIPEILLMRNNHFNDGFAVFHVFGRKRNIFRTNPDIDGRLPVEIGGSCFIQRGIRHGDLRVRVFELNENFIALFQERPLEEIHLRRPDKARNEFIARVTVKVFRRIDLLHETVFHDDDPRPHRHCFHLIVRDVNKRRLQFGVQFTDLGSHLRSQFCVEVGQGLV